MFGSVSNQCAISINISWCRLSCIVATLVPSWCFSECRASSTVCVCVCLCLAAVLSVFLLLMPIFTASPLQFSFSCKITPWSLAKRGRRWVTSMMCLKFNAARALQWCLRLQKLWKSTDFRILSHNSFQVFNFIYMPMLYCAVRSSWTQMLWKS